MQKTWVVFFDNWMLHLPQFKNFQFWSQFLHNQPKSAYFYPMFRSSLWHSSPIAILDLYGSKVSFLLVEWKEKEKKWTSIDIWRNICKRRFGIFTTITGTIGKLTTQPIFVLRNIIVAIIPNLVSQIFRQISIDVHFFSFCFHLTSKKETFEPF